MAKAKATTKAAAPVKAKGVAKVGTMIAANGKRIKLDWRTRYHKGSKKYLLAEQTEALLTGAKPPVARPAKAKAIVTPQVDPASVPGMPPMAVVIPSEAVAAMQDAA